MKDIIKILLTFMTGIIGMALISGCASIIQGGTQKVSINSRPSDAGVKVFDAHGQIIGTGATPCTLTLQRGAGFFSSAKYRVVIEKSGYVTREVALCGTVSGWYIGGNLLFGGVIGWLIIDPVTGAMWTLSPDEIRAEMQPAHSMHLNGKDGLNVVLLSSIPDEYRQFMTSVENRR